MPKKSHVVYMGILHVKIQKSCGGREEQSVSLNIHLPSSTQENSHASNIWRMYTLLAVYSSKQLDVATNTTIT